MKIFHFSGLAAAALLSLSACSGGDDGETSSPAASGEPAAAAQSEGGEAPTASPADAAPSEASAASEPATAGALPSEPPTAFLQCRSCHSVEPGKNGVGPSLAGIAGRPAASSDGFRYSDALRNSGITWSRDKLDEWLAGPMRMVPGTRMVQIVRDEEQRKAILDYLETLK